MVSHWMSPSMKQCPWKHEYVWTTVMVYNITTYFILLL